MHQFLDSAGLVINLKLLILVLLFQSRIELCQFVDLIHKLPALLTVETSTGVQLHTADLVL